MLDASVAVAALRETEPFHAESLRHSMPLFSGQDEIVVPALFDLELAAALVRRGSTLASVKRVLGLHFANRTLVSIGPRAVRAARGIVAATRLRAGDALYVWVAARKELPLVTFDQEILERAPLVGVDAVAP